jgi:antitoxin (DNA-binding transcriptional repressor) of toxin-antitoxin stability system
VNSLTEEVVITRRGKAIARIVPNVSGPDPQKALDAATRIRERAAKHGSGFSWSEWIAARVSPAFGD